MLILEIALPPYDRQCGWQGVDCAYKSAGICQGLLEKKTMGASCSRYLQGGYAIVSQLSCIFLPMASADGVFRDYASLTEILDLADDLDRIAFLKPYISRRAFSRRQYSDNLLNSPLKRPLKRPVARILLAKRWWNLGIEVDISEISLFVQAEDGCLWKQV